MSQDNKNQPINETEEFLNVLSYANKIIIHYETDTGEGEIEYTEPELIDVIARDELNEALALAEKYRQELVKCEEIVETNKKQRYSQWKKIESLENKLDEAAALSEKYKQALNNIASWGEGPVVSSLFDEPGSAETARTALLGSKDEGKLPTAEEYFSEFKSDDTDVIMPKSRDDINSKDEEISAPKMRGR